MCIRGYESVDSGSVSPIRLKGKTLKIRNRLSSVGRLLGAILRVVRASLMFIKLREMVGCKQPQSLRLCLVQMLSDQLHATVETSCHGGTEFTIAFEGLRTGA